MKASKTLINPWTYKFTAAITIAAVCVVIAKSYFPLFKQHVKSNSGLMMKILFPVLQYGPTWIMLFSNFYQSIIPPKINLGTRKRDPLNLSFDDLQGVDDAKVELSEIVDIIQEKSAYTTVGAKLPNSVLLYGPQGTGKTSLANAMAKEAELKFFSISASDYADVSTGPVLIKNLFQEARKFARFIIFINEIEVIGGKGEKFEHRPILHELLAQMDECNNGGSLMVVIAATERLDILDPTLKTKFSKKICVSKPDEDGRRKIMASLLEKVTMMQDEKKAICNHVASQTEDWVWTDLKNLVDDAVRLAARRDEGVLTHEDVHRAYKRVKVMINNNKDELTTQGKNIIKSEFNSTGYYDMN